MTKDKFTLTRKDSELVELVDSTDKRILAVWAIDCAMRVLSYFEGKYLEDNRPRKALETLNQWLKDGIFHMPIIRKASLDSHAAARMVGVDNPARSAARAAGQAVATAHVKNHAYGSAIYAQQAVYRASGSDQGLTEAKKERDWQLKHLKELLNNS